MIKNKPINTLEILNLRQVDFPPTHFDYITLPMKFNLEESLAKWISKNLKKRFFVGKKLCLDKKNSRLIQLTVGFEDSKEMSYFMLACPHLKYN
jgi:hypothetical protein